MCGKFLTHPQDKDRARIRDNQRRLRAKRKDYQQELEQRLSLCQRQGVRASTEVQVAARKVAGENKKLRTLLNKRGVDDDSIEAYLQSSSDTAVGTSPSAVGTLETLLEPRRPSCLDPDAPFCPEPRGRGGDGSTETEQDISLACIAASPSPWGAALTVRPGGLAPPSSTISAVGSSGADAAVLPTNLELPRLPRDAAVGLAGLQAYVFDPASQPLPSTSPALGASTTKYHEQQQLFPLPTPAQPPASLLSAAENSSIVTAAAIGDVLEDPLGAIDIGIVLESYDADALGNVKPYLGYS